MKNHSFINNSAGMRCKKFISLILTLTLVFSVFSIMPLSVSAAIGDTATIDGLTYTVTGEVYGSYTVSVTGFDNSTTNVIIPETVNIGGTEYTVSAIPKSSDTFFENSNIEYISIPGTVKSIDKSAFYKCTSLKEVTLNEGIEIINTSSFGYCAFESITFPISLKTLNTMAVRNCTALKDIYINSDVEIKSGAFGTTTNIENIYCYSSSVLFLRVTIFVAAELLFDHQA